MNNKNHSNQINSLKRRQLIPQVCNVFIEHHKNDFLFILSIFLDFLYLK